MGVHCLLTYSVAVENSYMNLSIVLVCQLTFPSAWYGLGLHYSAAHYRLFLIYFYLS